MRIVLESVVAAGAVDSAVRILATCCRKFAAIAGGLAHTEDADADSGAPIVLTPDRF